MIGNYEVFKKVFFISFAQNSNSVIFSHNNWSLRVFNCPQDTIVNLKCINS